MGSQAAAMPGFAGDLREAEEMLVACRVPRTRGAARERRSGGCKAAVRSRARLALVAQRRDAAGGPQLYVLRRLMRTLCSISVLCDEWKPLSHGLWTKPITVGAHRNYQVRAC